MHVNKIIDYLMAVPVEIAAVKIKGIKSAIKFDFGDCEDMFSAGQIVSIDIAPNMPYKNIYCEASHGNNFMGYWVYSATDGSTYIEFFPSVGGIHKSDAIARILPDKNIDLMLGSEKQEVIERALLILFSYINVINCSNVILIDNIPSPFKQSRIKKGKSPLFEYKTLHIHHRTTKNKNKGSGTHSSPRVHLRRGHIRKLSDDRTTWVQPCVVGDKSKGVVHKGYKYKKALESNDATTHHRR